jgi:hypothetical protein
MDEFLQLATGQAKPTGEVAHPATPSVHDPEWPGLSKAEVIQPAIPAAVGHPYAWLEPSDGGTDVPRHIERP